jgi:hypothetical protein
MQHLIEFLLVHLVKHPEDLAVEETEQRGRKIYVVKAHEEDIGRIIGHRGKTIQAVHRVASILAMDLNERFEIEIAD